MKRVLFWKWFDVMGQALMLAPLVLLFSEEDRGFAMLTYFTVGGWQVLSCGIHALVNPVPARAERMRYVRVLGWVLGIFGGTIFLAWACSGGYGQPEWIESLRMFFFWTAVLEGFLMFFIGAFMAVWYARVTMEEIGAIKHREEIHWKL